MNRRIIWAMTAALAIVVTPQLQAANPRPVQQGQVSDVLLTQLGLGGMQRVGDKEGHQVRGMAVVHGTPGTGFFVTDVNEQALLHSHPGSLMPGQVRHDLTNHTTMVRFHPLGIKTLGK